MSSVLYKLTKLVARFAVFTLMLCKTLYWRVINLCVYCVPFDLIRQAADSNSDDALCRVTHCRTVTFGNF